MIVHDGTDQAYRYPSPLRPGYFNVAEMDLKTLLAYGVDYAGLINYYNSDNRVDGDWTRIFVSDETMVLAHIGATDLTRLEDQFHNACEQPAHLRPTAAVSQAAFSHRLAVRLDDWHTWLGSATGKPGTLVRRVIERVIRRQLAPLHHDLIRLLGQYPHRLLEDHHIDGNALSKIWVVDRPADKHPAARRGTPEINALLQSCFHAFRNAATMVIETAATQFEHSLARRDHEPSLALYIAFCRLLRRCQQEINRFTARRLDYYYRDILQMAPCRQMPDTTFLVLALDGSLAEVMIPKGSEFTAGKDVAGKTLIYTADNDLRVTDTTVAALHTLYFEKNPLMSPENELGYVTGAWKTTLPPLDLNMAPAGQTAAPRPLFGASADPAQEPAASSIGMGLAIADPILLLDRGQRRITLQITFDTAPSTHPASIVKQLAHSARTTVQDAFYRVFKQMFTIALTADSGWYAVDTYLPDSALINPGLDAHCLCLEINLSAAAPSIVAYDPVVHGGGYDLHQPMVRLCINAQNELYPYSLLRTLTLKEIRIDVAVRGSTDLLAYNQHGQLDPSGPFQPFGPLPDLGSYLMVGSYEAACKHLTSFEVGLEWDTPPGGRHGMTHHYRAYDQPYLPGLYKVKTTLLSNGRWQPAKEIEQATIQLFQPQENEAGEVVTASRSTLAARNLHLHTPLTKTVAKKDFAFHLHAQGGFFKFTLSDPPYAFGHKAYPLLLSRALTTNALKKKKQPVPNQPYTPMLKSMEINYGAGSVIKLDNVMGRTDRDSQKGIIHLHPLGWRRIYPPADNRLPTFIADYGQGGNLLIGLSGAQPSGPLTLFFHIRSQTPIPDAAPRSAPRWYYLSSNQWRALAPRRIIADTTHAFTSSGIVTVDIPADITTGNSILPGRFFWLRVCDDQNPHGAGHLLGVAAQALAVTWQDRGNDPDHLAASLPAGRICRARTALAGIGAIMQPSASDTGRPKETDSQLTTRISERLRHKNRAVTSWDYERLVLNRFPEIYKVKCFAGTSRCGGRNTGARVLIAVIPRLETPIPSPVQQPMADARLLGRIKNYVAGLASPFARIEVCNPVYEQIQVRCAMNLDASAGAGAHIQRINQAVNRYLSPWSEDGRHPARFGWCIRLADIKAYLLTLDHVVHVTRLSMLHIVRQTPDSYEMFDSAVTRHTREKTAQTQYIKPKFPWGIAVPVKQHDIHTVTDYKDQAPCAAGIDDIRIGETFIIAGT